MCQSLCLHQRRTSQDTPSSCTSRMTFQGVDVITSTSHIAPLRCGHRVKSNLRRRVGPKQVVVSYFCLRTFCLSAQAGRSSCTLTDSSVCPTTFEYLHSVVVDLVR